MPLLPYALSETMKMYKKALERTSRSLFEPLFLNSFGKGEEVLPKIAVQLGKWQVK